jgi:serine/threonine protein kinase
VSERRWQRIRHVLEEALERLPEDRSRFLDDACGPDSDLRREVESLLAHADESDDSVESPGSTTGLVGRSLTHYRIVGELGQGGMGVVYRARDTELGREVAIKVLPEDFTKDPERLTRLEREARVLASLNHPNITTIYELGRTESSTFLVLELVSGPGLDERISRGPLPLAETLAVAKQIAEALEAAHEQGVVHRDLKPANIRLTEGGRVKILDFGLAKLQTSAVEIDPSHSPTLPRDRTASGMILGTASYMSPEQARGQRSDKRTDIWAFGCVVFEALTGRRAFSGATTSDVIAAILEREPDWKVLPQTTPPRIRALLHRCLERNRDRRLHDIADARVEIEDAVQSLEAGTSPSATGSRITWVAAAAVVLVGMVWILTSLLGKRNDGPETVALEPELTQLTSQAGDELFPSLSPSGEFLVYSASNSGQRDIYMQRVGGLNAINLTPNSPFDDTQPAYSPGGDRIAFRSERDGGGIFVMGATGESVRRVTEHGFNPSWSPDGREIAFSTESTGLHTISSGNGVLGIASVEDGNMRVLNVKGLAFQPRWSPHGRRIAYWGFGSERWRDIWTVSLETGETRPITLDDATDWNPAWSPDGRYIYFTSAREGPTSLWRVPVDEETGATLGSAEFVATSAPAEVVHISVSGDGTRVAYAALQTASNLRQVSFDPAMGRVVGGPVWITRTSKDKLYPALSPDGRWVAFSLQGAGSALNIALVRPDGTDLRMLTTDLRERNFMPNWSPDGSQLAFYSTKNTDKYELWTVRADGSGLQQLTTTRHGIYHVSWSPTSSEIAVRGGGDTYIFDPTKSEGQRLRKLSGPRGMFEPTSWSPDSHWLAGIHLNWNQTMSPAPQIALLSLNSEDYRVLTEGTYPKWLADGQKLVFQKGDGLYLLALESGNEEKILPVSSDPALVYQGIDLSRDNRTIYYTERTTESDIWMLTLPAVP